MVHYNAAIPVPAEPGYVDGGLASCAGAVTQAPAGESLIMWFVYAAFPQNASPRVSAVMFSVDFDPDQVAVAWWATRPGAVEVPYELGGDTWPNGNTGISVAFARVLTGTLSEVYCFAGYGLQGGTFTPSEHPDPNKPSEFADDSPASVSDPVVGYGTLGFGVPGSVPCPASVQTGACCRGLDGLCELVPEGSCNQVGDSYLGDGTACPVSGSCTNESGACCTVTVNGACSVMTFGACEAAGGFFAGFGITCSPNPVACDLALGACCTGSTCTITIQEDCVNAPENWNVREACLPNFCVGGACCIESNGACYIMRQPECIALGGLFDGGPVCNPNPCPQPGACCSSATGDCSIRTAAECALAGDNYLGDGVSCGDPNDPETNPCLQPIPGACCCRDSGDCYVTVETECGWYGCEFLGEGTECSPTTCFPTYGACCTGEVCTFVDEPVCLNGGGVWVGLQVECYPSPCALIPGACCDDLVCSIKTPGECWDAASSWLGPGSDCSPNPCLTVGPCCTADGGCVLTEQQGCGSPGLWLGPGVDCTPDPCPGPMGACCSHDGACEFTTQPQCQYPENWWGPGTSCEPNPCPQPVGACCTPTGLCSQLTQVECLSPSTWMGAEVDCWPSPCGPTGACCFGNDDCRILTWAQCAGLGGRYYLGHGSSCEGNPCPASDAGDLLVSERFALDGGLPNPSEGVTVIHYSLSQDQPMRLEIFDAAGRCVRLLKSGPESRGRHMLDWNGRNDDGVPLPAGVYYVRLHAGPGTLTKPLIRLR